jgi:hypothetical protein
MKTTVDLPDALMQRVKIAAARRRTTFKKLVIEALSMFLVPARPLLRGG